MIYLYAITDPLQLPVDATGLYDARLEALSERDVCGVYSSHEQLKFEPEPSLLWRHDEVVEQLMERVAVLPLRFGTTLESPEQLRDVLVRDQARFGRLLGRVRGCVELAVRVGLPPVSDATAVGGAEYMAVKLAAQRRREDAASRVLAPLRELATASSARKPGHEGAALSESYLVARETVGPFIDRVKEMQARHAGLALSCTGPWGPYSFVDEVEE